MTTAEFIKMLQEADPSGQAHIRMDGGIPKSAELKEGYWDGPYSYLDVEGRWVYSSEGAKVDIYTTDIEDFTIKGFNAYNIPEWEEIKKKFIFKLGSYISDENRSQRERSILEQAKESYDWSKKFYMEMRERIEGDAIERANKGWTWFQNKEVDSNIKPNPHVYYTWIVLDENGKNLGSCLDHVQAVYSSGLFERHDNGLKKGYYQWIKK